MPLQAPPLIPEEQILDYIPQRRPMVVLDCLWSATGQAAEGGWRVPEDHLLVKEGLLQPPALIEFLAQTAAAQAGYTARQEGQPPAVGFIGAVKNFVCRRQPRSGEQLRSRLQTLSAVFDFLVIDGQIWVGDELIASAELKLFLKKD